MHPINRHSLWPSDILTQEIETKTKSNQEHYLARYLTDVLTYSTHTLKLVNPSATNKCHILYLGFPHRLHRLVTQQL